MYVYTLYVNVTAKKSFSNYLHKLFAFKQFCCKNEGNN